MAKNWWRCSKHRMTITEQTYQALARTADLLKDEPLKAYTTFNVGGPADVLALPKNADQLSALLSCAREQNLPVTLIGGGSNLLISDKGIRGLVVSTRKLKSGIRIAKADDGCMMLSADSGEKLAAVCRFAQAHGLSGLEFAAGIPGTIGGAVFMNAGTPDGDMAGILSSLTVICDDTLKIKELDRSELEFGYRQSQISGILVNIRLKLKQDNAEKIKSRMTTNIDRKHATQPMGVASAGCFFKNPATGKPAGQLIEEAGLKGLKINDAQISPLHANYIVNLKNARCTDILKLQNTVRQTVYEKFNVKLETEVRFEGE